jgi:hypothetical protein
MVRVGRGARRDHAREVPRRYHRQACAAYALGLFFLADQTARAHVAHLAAGPLVSYRTRLKLFGPFKGRGYFFLTGDFQQYLCGRINGFKVFSHE